MPLESWKGTTNQAMSWPNCIPCWLSERAEPKLMRDEGGAFQLKLRNCGFLACKKTEVFTIDSKIIIKYYSI